MFTPALIWNLLWNIGIIALLVALVLWALSLFAITLPAMVINAIIFLAVLYCIGLVFGFVPGLIRRPV